MRMQENRRFVRWEVTRPARFRLSRQEHEGEEQIALLKDVSFSGAKLALSESLRLNDTLDMEMEIPDEHNPVHCQAKVVWQKSVDEAGAAPFACGLYFTQIKSRDKDKIFQYVRGMLLKTKDGSAGSLGANSGA
ncbi:PilZ domain-containing protein [bacterium]|nr:MAG: PilZ domain-containing protein [bacterium]